MLIVLVKFFVYFGTEKFPWPILKFIYFDCFKYNYIYIGQRPITSMCSGSDLDGDLYWVTWDKDLIPQMQEEPME